MEIAILPRIEAFSPDVVVNSAGFNAHHRDVLSNLNLIEADYAWVTLRLMEIAKRRCGGRIVSVLEGGYHLDGLARSVAVHVLALMEGSDAVVRPRSRVDDPTRTRSSLVGQFEEGGARLMPRPCFMAQPWCRHARGPSSG